MFVADLLTHTVTGVTVVSSRAPHFRQGCEAVSSPLPATLAGILGVGVPHIVVTHAGRSWLTASGAGGYATEYSREQTADEAFWCGWGSANPGGRRVNGHWQHWSTQ